MPPPSRDRLSRPVDISTLYRGAARKVDLKVDEPGLRWAGLSGSPSSGSGRRRAGPHRAGRTVAGGRENVTPGRVVRTSRGRGRVLPYWYPRTPLRDITAIVRAIERRRAQLHQDDQDREAPQEETNAEASSSAQLEHEAIGSSTPLPTLPVKPEVQPTPNTRVGKIMANILSNEKGQDSNPITPQKRLLDSIDEVREVLVDEQRKLEKTPAAQRAETKKKVRTLMSMR